MNLQLRRDVKPRGGGFADIEQETLILVAAEHEMRRGREHALDRREFLRNKTGDLLQRSAFDEYQQIITARHQIAGLHFVEAREALRQPVEPAATLWRNFHFNHRANRSCCSGLAGEIEHRTPAEEDFILLQLFQVLFDFAHGEARDLRDLRRRETTAFE